ncbi:hydrogenase iron-sulfur subunit [Haloprofundus salilacus]|uniref:hydrogenase iron-sulfur subunit n=1 Tax=Haloprofundus salilacus TaxID=2876190 RepID=UPI001CCB2D72|nr:hydrogenase iron-sulfur subunit [Haloprofundus salilacus]
MNVGAFVCSCGDTCDIDLERTRDGVRDVDVVASSTLLCEDGLPAMAQLVDEYELDQLLVTAPDDGCQRRFRALAEEKGLHPEATSFVDHRAGAGWVHDRDAATDKTARLLNARRAGLEHEAASRSVTQDAGDAVVVVGDAETAAALADSAKVTLVADGRDFHDSDVDLSDVTVERGRVVGVEGEFGEFRLTLHSEVTDDCVSCMKCVKEGPEGMLTRYPVDIDPDAPGGEWEQCCPTDAIDRSGIERAIEVDQVVYPEGSSAARGGRLGYYTGPVDAGTVAAVESLLGGVTKPKHLDLDLDVCAAGESSQQGCTACTDACPHDAVRRPTVDSVEFDEVACQDCGACTSACPTGATMLREPSNERLAREVEALLDVEEQGGGWLFSRGEKGIETPVVAFVCSERAADALRAYGRRAASGTDLTYPPVLPVSVNCTDTVGEAHVLHALAAGADGVAVVGCGDSCLHSGPDPKAELVERLNRATADLGLGDRTAFFAPDPAEHESFVAELEAFVDGLSETPIPAGEHRATGVVRDDKPNPAFNTHDWALESVRAIVARTDPDRDVIRGLETFGLMDVSEACNLTPTCSTLCPTNAIRRTDDGDLQFSHEDCVNCGLCEEGCPETAITIETGLDLARLPERNSGERWETVYEGEMVECVRCGKPFASRGSIEKVKGEVGDVVEGIAPGADASVFDYCGDCRARLLFENGGAQ